MSNPVVFILGSYSGKSLWGFSGLVRDYGGRADGERSAAGTLTVPNLLMHYSN